MVRYLTSMMLVALTLAVCATVAIADGRTPGDLDNDGDVDLKDWYDFKAYICPIRMDIYPPIDQDRYDFDGDGDVDLNDLVALKNNFTGSDDGILTDGLVLDYTDPAETFIVNPTDQPIALRAYTVYSPSGGLYPENFHGIGARVDADPMWVINNLGTGGMGMTPITPSDFHVTELAGSDAAIVQPGFRFSIGNIVPDGVNDVTLTFAIIDVVYKSDQPRPPNYPGDTNGDGDVDLEDFCYFKNAINPIGPVDPRADFDHNGQIDLNDFVILKQNFGHVSKQ